MVDFELDFPAEVCEPEAAYNANRELQQAWEIVEETGANLFLTGKAGTGKTTFLKKLRENSTKRMVVLAPTGVAAINAAGNTIHSFFQLPFAPYIPGKGFLTNDRKFLNMSRMKKRLISSMTLLVIDEISMVRPDTLDAIDSILRRLRNSSLPFGGLQLLLIGDLRQLPPVVKDDEWSMLKEHYSTPYFFESKALQRAGYKSVELTVVYRQSDARFLDILNAIRDGNATAETLAFLNRRCNPGFNPPDSEGYIRLTTHNRTAGGINESRLRALTTPMFNYEATIDGEFPESAFPADRTLRLRQGAQVMFIKNDTGGARRYYNGLIGTVTSLSEEKICVEPIGGGETIDVEPAEWENTKYAVDESTGAITQQAVGTFRQYPLQLAWAITIHKSQGLTFDRAIIDAMHSFAAGQTYVALSRCRSLEGLVLDSPIPPSAIIIDHNVNGFIDYCEANAPDHETIASLKNQYLLTLLSELFDFEPLRRSFEDFARAVREYVVPLYPETEPRLDAMRERMRKDICEVGRRFIASYSGSPVNELLEAPESNLTERIKNGCGYFREIMEETVDFVQGLPRDIANSAYLTRLNNTYDAFSYNLLMKQEILKRMAVEDFSVAAYLDAKARATLKAEDPPAGRKKAAKAAKSKPKKEKAEKKPKGYSTFETLALFREGKNIQQIAEERGLKESTISSHIMQLIQLGRIDLSELADAATVAAVKRVEQQMPEAEYMQLYEAVNATLPSPIPEYIFRLCRTPKKKQPEEGTEK